MIELYCPCCGQLLRHLKPCPCCGSPARIHVEDGPGELCRAVISCMAVNNNVCTLQYEAYGGTAEDAMVEATKGWNSRVPEEIPD